MVLSVGSASPMLAAIKRCGSLVEFSLITVNATCPGLMCFNPSLREINLQLGGKIDETRTMLQAAMPAFRSASSKLESRSRCFPTPLVKNIFLATNAIVSVRGLHQGIEKRKISSCGKVTRRLLECQRQTPLQTDFNLCVTRFPICLQHDESIFRGACKSPAISPNHRPKNQVPLLRT